MSEWRFDDVSRVAHLFIEPNRSVCHSGMGKYPAPEGIRRCVHCKASVRREAIREEEIIAYRKWEEELREVHKRYREAKRAIKEKYKGEA